jgi:hypothetical protein
MEWLEYIESNPWTDRGPSSRWVKASATVSVQRMKLWERGSSGYLDEAALPSNYTISGWHLDAVKCTFTYTF